MIVNTLLSGSRRAFLPGKWLEAGAAHDFVVPAPATRALHAGVLLTLNRAGIPIIAGANLYVLCFGLTFASAS